MDRKHYFKLIFNIFLKFIEKINVPRQLLIIIIKLLHYYVIPLIFIITYVYGNTFIKKIVIIFIFLIFFSQIYFKTCLIYEFEYFLEINKNNVNDIVEHFENKIKKNENHVLPFCITAISFFLFLINLK